MDSQKTEYRGVPEISHAQITSSASPRLRKAINSAASFAVHLPTGCGYRDIQTPAIVQRYFTVQSIWLPNCLQRLHSVSMTNRFRTTSDNDRRSTWRTSVTVECEGYCCQIQGKSKTTKERNCWISEHYSNEWKREDWCWTSGTLSLCVRGLEESDQSSST